MMASLILCSAFQTCWWYQLRPNIPSLNAGPPEIVFTILGERKTMAEQKRPQVAAGWHESQRYIWE